MRAWTSFAAWAAAGTVSLWVCAPSASAAAYRLSDHPDGSANPPPYGLRLDGLFAGRAGATGGITTFSFDTYGNTILRVIDNGSSIRITINGTLFGGEDSGVGTGFGAGDYQFSMVYDVNVTQVSDGWRVNSGVSNINFGSLTALSGALAGESWNLFDVTDGLRTFVFRQDDHRLDPNDPTHQPFLGWHIGRGWLDFDGATTSGTRDVLFVGHLIPSPLAGAMASVGLLGIAARRRR